MKKYISFLLFISILATSFAQEQFVQTGIASFYADRFEGRTTASGEKFSQDKLTAAHLTLPFGCIVKVTSLENNKTIEVRINDRGPFIHGRIIDLSKSAASKLDIESKGLSEVKIEVIKYPDNVNPKKITKPVDKPVSTTIIKEEPVTKTQTEITSPMATTTKEYYQVSSQQIKPVGYGVQIGSFKELVNLLKIVSEVENKYKYPVNVEVALINEQKVYRLLIGKFSNKTEADQFKNLINDQYKGCFVVTYK